MRLVGCDNACVIFFLARCVRGVCQLLETELARNYVPTCCCYIGKREKERERERKKETEREKEREKAKERDTEKERGRGKRRCATGQFETTLA